MRGRPGCPTGQKKNSVEATDESPPFLLLQGKVGYQVAPSSDPVCAPAHLWFMVASLLRLDLTEQSPDCSTPKGRLWGWEGPFRLQETHPSQPAQRGAGRYGR